MNKDINIYRKKLKEGEFLIQESRQIAHIGSYVFDIKSNEWYSTEILDEIFGIDSNYKRDLEGWLQIVHPDYREDMRKYLNDDVISAKQQFNKEYLIIKNNTGEQKWLHGMGGLKTDDTNEPIFLVGTIQDITPWKQTEFELEKAKLKAEESDKLKSAFLTNLSHEIRTPLNGIVGFSQLLNESDISTEKRTQYAQVINESGKQLLNIINDIIDISKIESGQIDVNMSKVSINEKLYETYGFFKPVLSKKEIELILIKGLVDEDSIVFTDGTKLQQIINNLINNALKFTSQGYIEFGYYIKNDFIEFYVKDTGIGITPEFQEKIFDRFSQEDAERSKEQGGTGLGLSITKAYVELLGGKIWLKSKPSLGTTFYFTIPYKPANKQKTNGTPVSTHEGYINLEGNTVLIAEDNDMNYMLLEELLVKSKAKIIRAKNGREAVDYCKKLSDIDLVLMDIKMPIMDGYEAIQEIKSFNPTLPIIAQSAFAMIEDERKALDMGSDDYVSKPIKKDLLISKISKFLKR